jgi:hypothetical protein
VYVAKGKEVKEGEKYSLFGGVLKNGSPIQRFLASCNITEFAHQTFPVFQG